MLGGRVQLIDGGLFERVLGQARASSRRRMNFNFHATFDENPSRFLNVLLRGTYITPHRHSDPPKAESLLVLEGRVAFFVFDGAGRIEQRVALGRGESGCGIDVGPGVWHTAAALSEQAVCFEVKPGPYAPASDKEFAPWAPREGDPRSVAYLESLLCDFEQSSPG
jgi:cupin fold WbuC family metalloprotein